MDKRFVIIHQSEIVRKGLWAIMREAFHYEFILLKEVNEVADYSGFSNTELFIFLQDDKYSEATKALIGKLLNSSNHIEFILITSLDSKNEMDSIFINDPSIDIIRKIKQIAEKKEEGANSMADLSEREKDVLVQVALGLTNKEIAEKLFISIHTVITHRKHITDKLGIKSISGLTVYAILNKLIDTENIDLATLI
ncbi:MAG: LuxR C-terminal-related transcriptional regulator [Salinivirgaceae bacterium]|jgi:DNA-binding CsgD family transcriptional regulator|nr:LuxR C-terminal-related transcriptional regulator [Salinivirgaceae bacterium]